MPKKVTVNSSHRPSKADGQKDQLSEIARLRAQILELQEKERRARGDYQNLVRRNQDDRLAMIKLASSALIGDLLQPLDHLTLAAGQLNDQGLNMVIGQFWQALKDHGLVEIDPHGQEFDVATMTAVEPAKGDGKQPQTKGKVLEVRSKGYQLNGKVLKFAQVTVG